MLKIWPNNLSSTPLLILRSKVQSLISGFATLAGSTDIVVLLLQSLWLAIVFKGYTIKLHNIDIIFIRFSDICVKQNLVNDISAK